MLPCRPTSIAVLLALVVPLVAVAQDAIPPVPGLPPDAAVLGQYGVAGALVWLASRLIGLVDRWTRIVEETSEAWRDGKLSMPTVRVVVDRKDDADAPQS